MKYYYDIINNSVFSIDNFEYTLRENQDYEITKEELGFIDTPHPTYYLHTIRALDAGYGGSYIVFSVISTQSTAYTKSSLYSAFPNKSFKANGFYSSPKSADYRVNGITPKSATQIQFDYGDNNYITATYGGTYFADDVRKIT